MLDGIMLSHTLVIMFVVKQNPLQDDGMEETQNPAAQMDVEQNTKQVYEF